MPKRSVFLFLIIFLLFSFFGLTLLDFDFGWHIRLGEMIIKTGIVRVDPFSYTMPSYPFVDHEWLSNVMFYVLYHTIQWQGMAVLFAALAIASVVILIPHKQWQFTVVPAIVVFSTFLSRFSIKTQVMEWLLFSILIRMVMKKEWWQRWRFAVPFLMLAWVNLHGSFALGIVIIVLACVLHQEKKRWDWITVGVAVGSLVVTFINPYGWRIWNEVWMQMSDGSLHQYITEWGPFWTKPDFAFICMVALIGGLGWRYRTSFSKIELAVAGSTFLLALSAVRHIPLFMISATPILFDLFRRMHSQSRTVPSGEKRFWQFYRTLVLISIFVFLLEAALSGISATMLTEKRFYPARAIAFLKTQQLSGHIFAPYAWGGYLDWKLPEEKVFIDGRMPSFRWNAPNGESANALAEYRTFLYEEQKQEIIDAYDISYILLPSQQNNATLWEKVRIKSSMSNEAATSIRQFLAMHGWVALYTDEQAVIYTRTFAN